MTKKTFLFFIFAFAAACFHAFETASAQHSCCGGGGGHATHGGAGAMDGHAGHAGDAHAAHREAPPLRASHGGQIATIGPNSFEVVYLPKEIRVYFYGPSHQPESARGVEGEVALYWISGSQAGLFPLRYPNLPPEFREQDYVGVPVDLSKVREGQMTAAFKFTRLPYGQPQPTVFTQTVAFASPHSPEAAGDDRAAIARQGICPVTGGKLGSMGEPVRVDLVGGRSLFVCCEGCIAKVRANPDFYLARLAQPHGDG